MPSYTKRQLAEAALRARGYQKASNISRREGADCWLAMPQARGGEEFGRVLFLVDSGPRQAPRAELAASSAMGDALRQQLYAEGERVLAQMQREATASPDVMGL